MREKVIIEIISRCINFLDTAKLNQLRLVLESELHNYDFQKITTDLVPSNQYQNKIRLYLASKKVEGLSDKTLKEYKLTLIRFAMTVNKELDQVDEMDIRLYIAKRMQEGLKNSTLNIMVGQIKTFYQWMYDNEYIRKNPSKLVKNVKFDKYIRKALTEDEFEKLKYACKTPREHAIVSLFYSTASRVSEIYALNKDDIDWYNDTIKVFGKGRKERYEYLSANAKLYLSKYLESRNDSESALFVGSRIPHKRLSCRAIEDEFNDLGKRAGITSRVYPHLLRHTMATNWLRTGGDIAEVSKILGHSNISTTQIYAQVNNDNIKSSFKKHML